MKILNELQLAKELIRFPSITPIDAGVIKFLEKKLKKLGFKTKILEFNGVNVIRFSNDEVLSNIDNVLNEIKKYLPKV